MFNPRIVSNLSDDELAALLYGINAHVNGGHEDNDTNIALYVSLIIGAVLLIPFTVLLVFSCKQAKRMKQREGTVVNVDINSRSQPSQLLNNSNKPFGN